VERKPKRSFWDRVCEAMQDAGMKPTQTGAAKLINISQPSVAEWKELDGYPTMANAVELARKLNVNVEWLLLERGAKRPIPTDALAQRLWDMWGNLDEGTKHELVGLATGRLRRSEAATPISGAKGA
jgi:transcriptional regulator with XRE-family HTH domain